VVDAPLYTGAFYPGASPRADAFAPLGLLALQTLSAGAEVLFMIV